MGQRSFAECGKLEDVVRGCDPPGVNAMAIRVAYLLAAKEAGIKCTPPGVTIDDVIADVEDQIGVPIGREAKGCFTCGGRWHKRARAPWLWVWLSQIGCAHHGIGLICAKCVDRLGKRGSLHAGLLKSGVQSTVTVHEAGHA